MKKMIRIGLATLLCLTLTTFSSCKKAEKGEDGPIGLTGATGPAGNANVENYSVDVNPGDWSYNSLYKRWYYKYYTSVNSNSAVLAYVMSGSGKQAIPYHEHSPVDIEFGMATDLFLATPYIEFQYTNVNSFTTAPTSTRNFYLVVIPPAMIAAHPETDFKNYEEVKATFHLK